MRYYVDQYRRSPYSIIVSRWKRHLIHAFAVVGVAAIVYAVMKFKP